MSKIIATGSYLPAKAVSNTDLIEQTGIDSSDEWITQRTGIKQRYFAEPEETIGQVATKAAENLLANLEKDVLEQIDLIIVATMSSNLPTPSVASQVQANLGITKSWAFDVSGACSGFVMALETAEKITRDKKDGYSLIIGAEKMSNILDFDDRSTSILFGDGSGAILIEHDGKGLPDYRSELVSIPDPAYSIAVQPENELNPLMTMEGRYVFNFVLREVIPSLADFIQQDDKKLDYLISHQANYRFLEIISKKIKLDLEQIPSNIDKVANTSAASIPILLDQLVKDKKIYLDTSQNIVLVGYGGGLAWGQISLKI